MSEDLRIKDKGTYMKVLLFWNSQFVGHNGGMEKVFCNLSNALCRRGHQVSGMYCTERTGEIYTPLDPACRLINLANRLSGGLGVGQAFVLYTEA